MISKISGLLAFGLLAGPSTAGAVPFVFEFNMPAFTAGPLVGQTSILRLTADNGSASDTNQTYLNSQILTAQVTVGAEALNFASPPYTRGEGPAVPFIFTDGAGSPTLDLTTPVDTYLSWFAADISVFQLGGQFDPTSYRYLSYFVSAGPPTFQWGAIESITEDILPPPRKNVPEPGSVALLGLGLVGIGLSRRRKPRQQVQID